MKKNLGRIFLILILISISLDAKEYVWSASINKKSAYVNEAVHLHYRCEFDTKNELYVIEFNPVGMYEDFDIYLLSESEKILDNKRINDFEFVAFLKKSAHVEFNFDVLMKKTNQDSIDNTVLGRDNAESEQFTKHLIKQKTLSIDVLDNDVKLVGNFEFYLTKDKPNIKAYEPYHLELKIVGVGDLDKLDALDLNVTNAKVFKGKAQKNFQLSKDGYKGSWIQKFAIVASEDFDVGEITYRYLDNKEGRLKIFKSKPFRVKVQKLYKKEDLLDKVEDKKYTFKIEYIFYLLIFIFGYLLGKIRFKKVDKNKPPLEFVQKVKATKTVDELSVLLIIEDCKKYQDLVEDMQKSKISVSQVKKKLIQ